ncbi:plant UBX domain-containing protein 8-like isoform X1 [Musa acuminata AAA Group]|uniref:UBX domain-containing protein n=2 Tax=Musa acuminata subsp. malaccensis TaxID=214687 RepID=A0A804KU46_MUSAM|nr:PREDICTED: plant UBX domain-containing protein 8 isoform X1 [Musa acuminata subsp. malaccensis]
MARFSRDAIDTFMSITGAPEAVALQKLEERGGDLNEAINAHFSEVDRVNTNQGSVPPREDLMQTDDAFDSGPLRPSFPLLSATRDVNPFSLLDSKFGLFSSLFDGGGASSFPRHGPRVSHPREVREIPIDFKDDNRGSGPSGVGPRIEEVTGNETAHGHEIHGTVIIDDEDDDGIQPTHGGHGVKSSADTSLGQCAGPSVSPLADMTDYSNEIEEEMIKAAIEASKREAQQHDIHDHPKSPATDDTDLARAVSLSLKTAEQERVLRQQGVYVGENPSIMEVDDAEKDAAFNGRHGFVSADTGTSSQVKSEEENPFVLEESEDIEEQPLVRHRSRHLTPANVDSADSGQVSYSASGPPQPIDRHPQHNGHVFENDEWGGISSEEHDEAVMLEAAMFGGIPDGTSYRFGYPPRQMPRPPSPTLTAQRLLREQQDDEYLAALQADREKELKAQQEAQLRHLEETAAREAALQKQKHEEEENQKKQLEEEELELKLAAKQSLLPQEPSLDDGNAVTLLVRMPDGSRRGRRFLKSDKLQLLFDYIDVGKVVKPGSYRLVRPYPRRAFTEEETQLSLSELGLTSKQEALFLELI